MRSEFSKDKLLAIIFMITALVIIFIWVPMDTGTGIIGKVRRKFIIGDALAPSVAGVILLAGATLLFFRPSNKATLKQHHLVWVAGLTVLFILSFSVMRYAGPITASLFDLEYRNLRTTIPWNYIGFLLGGTGLVGGLTSIVEKRILKRHYVIAFGASLTIALFYDLPFEDLLLPPNGDV